MLMQISELKILVVLVIRSFFMLEKSFFNHGLIEDGVFLVFEFVNQSANVLGNFLAFVAFEPFDLVFVVLGLMIPTVLALISSVSRSVGRRFLVTIFDTMSAFLAIEAESLLHKLLAFFRAESVYDSINIHGHGIAIVLRFVSIGSTILGVLGESRIVVSFHHLGLTPVVVESDCLRHPSSKRSRCCFSHQDSSA